MAYKIKDTPVIKGSDAQKFFREEKRVENGISKAERSAIRDRLLSSLDLFSKGSQKQKAAHARWRNLFFRELLAELK